MTIVGEVRSLRQKPAAAAGEIGRNPHDEYGTALAITVGMDAAQVVGHRAQVGAFHWRTGLRLEVSLDVMSYLRGELTLVPLKDLNANGCLIESPKRLEAGSIHQLRFTTSHGTTVTLIARTVDCRQPLFGPANRWHVGFTFPHAGNPAVRSQIVALLEDRAAAESR